MKRGRLIALVGFGALGAAVACSSGETSGAPLGQGDHLIVDVDASTLPMQPDAAPDPIFAPLDGSSQYGTGYDAAASLTVCAPPKGGSNEAGAAADDDAAAPTDASAASDDGGSDSSCVPFPASCASQPNCVCLLTALLSQLPCAQNCSVLKHGFTLKCP